MLFRRISTKQRKPPGTEETKELFLALPEAQKVAIRQKVLECFQNEALPQVRHKIGDAVAELARQYSDNGKQKTQEISEGSLSFCYPAAYVD